MIQYNSTNDSFYEQMKEFLFKTIAMEHCQYK